MQVELKKGETVMINIALHLPVTFLREAFNDLSGVPLDNFELYYRGKRLEGEAALSSWGVGKDSTIEVKMRGRGGMPRQGSPSGDQILTDKRADQILSELLSRPEGRASAEATLALETAAAASAASSTQATEELMLSEVATSEAVEVSVEAEGKAARTLNKEKMGL